MNDSVKYMKVFVIGVSVLILGAVALFIIGGNSFRGNETSVTTLPQEQETSPGSDYSDPAVRMERLSKLEVGTRSTSSADSSESMRVNTNNYSEQERSDRLSSLKVN